MSTYALTVRDAMLARLQAKPFFSGFARTSKTKALEVWTDHIPYLGVYFISESLAPDGEDNVGEPRFRSMARYGFSVIVQNNDPDLAEAQLDLAFLQITDLMTDSSLYRNPEARIQAFAAGDRSHSYGNLTNMTPFAELRFDMSVDLGTITWAPIVDDDLKVVHIDVPYPKVGDPVEIAAEYAFYGITPVDLVVPSPTFGRPDFIGD